jgi:hypothetical protein
MTALERLQLIRAEEQAAAEVERARSARSCACGAEVAKGKTRCHECSLRRRNDERRRTRVMPSPKRDATLALLRSRRLGVSVDDVMGEIEVERDAAQVTLLRLVRAGLARRVGVGRYEAVKS